jgi:hypothetical protein
MARASALHDAGGGIGERDVERVVGAIFRLAVDAVAGEADEAARLALGREEEGKGHDSRPGVYGESADLTCATNWCKSSRR